MAGAFEYRRVTRQRRCRICGKPDWCSYSPNEEISFCARVTVGATRISRQGWGVFCHSGDFLEKTRPLPCPSRSTAKRQKLAPLAIRDLAYRTLVDCYPLNDLNWREAAGFGLGQVIRQSGVQLGIMPARRTLRDSLAREVRRTINLYDPARVRETGGCFSGIPGLWVDRAGRSRLWLDHDLPYDLLLVPFRDELGRIQACQLRNPDPSPKRSAKYLWLSLPSRGAGLASQLPLHFPRSPGSNRIPVLVVEGALKAEIAAYSMGDVQVVAIGGVAASHEQAISLARYRPLEIAFDSDHATKKPVLRQLARLIGRRIEDSATLGYPLEIRIIAWSQRFKGIDDALAGKAQIKKLPISEWLNSLTESFRKEAISILERN